MNNKILKKNFKISLSYTTNFKPADFLFFNNIKIFNIKPPKNKKNFKIDNKIISRNFFLFLILLKYNNDNNNNFNTSIFVKPRFKKFITLLRAPYRYKLSRHQFMFSRYYVVFSITSSFENIFFDSVKDVINFINLSKSFYVWFESNIVSQHQAKLFFNFYLNNNFKII